MCTYIYTYIHEKYIYNAYGAEESVKQSVRFNYASRRGLVKLTNTHSHTYTCTHKHIQLHTDTHH